MKKILILYISPMSGHHKAALSIQKACLEKDPNCQIKVVNALRAIGSMTEKWMLFLYMTLIRHFPGLWNFIYDNDQFKKKMSGWRSFIQHRQSKNLLKVIREYRPDKIICTQAYPCQLIARYRKLLTFKIKLIGVITDYVVHAYWHHPRIDQYFVPNEEGLHRLVAWGTKPEKIFITGIPIDPDFHRKVRGEEKAVIQKRKLNILIMGGGHGIIPIDQIISGLGYLQIPYQAILITGNNKKLYKKFKRKKKYIDVYQYVDNIGDFMDRADLLISKSGGITSAEAMIKGLPMLICSPLPGQEVLNADYLVQKGVALRITDSADLADKIERLRNNPVLLAQMKEKIRLLVRPVNHLVDVLEDPPTREKELSFDVLEVLA